MRTINSREVYRNAWMRVREDTIVRADGSRGIYGVVDKQDFALVVPQEHGGLWLVEQYRYPVQRRAWEFPQGSWDAGREGDPGDLAAAELREETGLRAGEMQYLGHLYGAYGFCSQGFHAYLATDLEHGPTAREPSEHDMRHKFVTEAQFQRMIDRGEVVDAATLAAYGLLLLRQQHPGA